MKNSRRLKFTLILYAVLFLAFFGVLLNYTRNLNFYRNNHGQTISTVIFLANVDNKCRLTTREGYVLTIYGCENLLKGEYYTILGTVSQSSAKANFYQLYVDVKEINQIHVSRFSLIGIRRWYWLMFSKLTSSFSDYIQTEMPLRLSSEAYYLVQGLTLGTAFTTYPDSFLQLVRSIGLAHMVAVSGFHLNVINTQISSFLKRLSSRTLKSLLIIFFLQMYIYLVSAPISLLRAFFMLVFSLIGRNFLFKRVNSFHFLFIVFIFTGIVRPDYVFNLGCQLSFAATAGVLALGYLRGESNADEVSLVLNDKGLHTHYLSFLTVLRESFAVSFWAQLFTLPFIINAFGQLSVWSVLSTLLFSAWIASIVSVCVPLFICSFLLRFCSSIKDIIVLPFWSFIDDISTLLYKFFEVYAKFFSQAISFNISFNWCYFLVYYIFVFVFFCVLSFYRDKSYYYRYV